jgi:AcrR family transcriptional regulator
MNGLRERHGATAETLVELFRGQMKRVLAKPLCRLEHRWISGIDERAIARPQRCLRAPLTHACTAVRLKDEKVLIAAIVLVAMIPDYRATGKADVGEIERADAMSAHVAAEIPPALALHPIRTTHLTEGQVGRFISADCRSRTLHQPIAPQVLVPALESKLDWSPVLIGLSGCVNGGQPLECGKSWRGRHGVESTLALLGTRRKAPQARGLERRRRLLESARTLLGSHELDALTLSDVAAHAHVPKGSAYFFYADIGALYAALQAVHQQELMATLQQPIRKPIRRWQDVIVALNARGMTYYIKNPAARQLQIGPKTSPDLKLRDRRSDERLGKLYEQQVAAFFMLPPLPERARIFFRAVEIADLMFSLSVIEHGTITRALCAEADRACIAYLESYLTPNLPRRSK